MVTCRLHLCIRQPSPSPAPPGRFLACFWLSASSGWLKSCLCCGGPCKGECCSQGWSYMAGTCVSPMSPTCLSLQKCAPWCQTCSDLPISCSPKGHFSLHQSPGFVVAAASLEECGWSQHSCMKTELTLCYISTLLTWNSTVSFLADK